MTYTSGLMRTSEEKLEEASHIFLRFSPDFSIVVVRQLPSERWIFTKPFLSITRSWFLLPCLQVATKICPLVASRFTLSSATPMDAAAMLIASFSSQFFIRSVVFTSVDPMAMAVTF